MEKNNSCHPVTVEWSSYKALYIWKFLNCRISFPSAFKGLIGLLWKKGHNLSLVMQFENFEIYKDLYVHVKPLNHDWGAKVVFPTQILLIFGGSAVAVVTFEIYGWKFIGYLILICSFRSCWQLFQRCFCVYKKLNLAFSSSDWVIIKTSFFLVGHILFTCVY